MIKTRIKSLIGTVQRLRTRRRKLAEARTGLRHARALPGYDPSFARQARDYAGDVLGWTGHAPWLELYACHQGRFAEGWIPDTYYADHVLARANGNRHLISRHRTLNARLFGTGYFPDIAYRIGDRLLDPDYRPIGLAELKRHRHGLVFKPDFSGFGKAVRVLEPDDLTADRLARLPDGVFQRKIRPDPEFDAFGLRAVSTLRLGTVLDPDRQPSVRTAYLKIGRRSQSHVDAASQIRVPVNWLTGALDAVGNLPDWSAMTGHPDTGQPFAGHTIPRIADCVALVCDLHRAVPLPDYLCWDLVVDDDGAIQVLEWEGGIVSFAEARQGPCFADLNWDRYHLADTGSSR